MQAVAEGCVAAQTRGHGRLHDLASSAAAVLLQVFGFCLVN